MSVTGGGTQAREVFEASDFCRLLLGLDFYYFAPVIVTAFGADTMRHFALVAIRTLGERVAG